MIKTVEYVWLGGHSEPRSKTKVVSGDVTLETLPNWNYDGSIVFFIKQNFYNKWNRIN